MGLKYRLIICVLFFSSASLAQMTGVQENNPAGLKWYQINTAHFRLLFPEGFEQPAQRVANTLEHIREPEGETIGAKPRKISVLLQNQSSISNGFVTVAPRRSEFFAMPAQNYNFQGTVDWLTLLSTHEYRHMAQFQRSKTGFSKLVYYTFGQLAQAGLAFVAAPQWFWEGDAVVTETAFTQSGRGRIPQFDLLFRTNLLEGRKFNYHKQYLRSYKHNIPDHYVLGYHMVSYLRRKTGEADIWSDITHRAWALPFIPFTFSNAIKKESGMHVVDLFNNMASDLTKEWQAQIDEIEITPFDRITKREGKAYTDYAYPQVLGDGTVVAMKSGIGDIAQLVTISPEGDDDKEFVVGPLNQTGMLSGHGDRVVWNEYRYDPRWRVKTFSIVEGYDLLTRKKHVISKSRSRYSGAAISPDGRSVATVETTTSYQNRLVVLNYETGDVEKTFDNPSNNLIGMPSWSDDGKSLVALQISNQGKLVSMYNVDDGSTNEIIPLTNENIGYPVVMGQHILYNSPYSGIDNIYAINIETKKRFQLTSSKYGAYNPSVSPDGKTIYYNDQTKDGLDVVKIDFDTAYWKPIEEVKTAAPLLYPTLVEQEGQRDLVKDIPEKSYAVKRYHRASGMINPHSWGPYFENTLTQINLGVTSEDVLSTTSIDVGYLYDVIEQTGTWKAGFSYQGFYPILDVGVTAATREETATLLGRHVKFNWEEYGGAAGLRIPLILTRSKYLSSIEVGNSIGYKHVTNFRNTVTSNGSIVASGFDRIVAANDTLRFVFTDRVSDGELLYNRFYANYNRSLKTSRRDFNPRWGQFLAFDYYTTPYGGDFTGSLWMARGSFYFPGLFKHHSVFLRGGFQSELAGFEDLNRYHFRNVLFRPRGFAYPRDTEFLSLSANYALPLWYPDINIGPFLNIQRIKGSAYFDYGQGKGENYFYYFNTPQGTKVYFNDNAETYQSVGFELRADINVMRLLQQFEVGVRMSYAFANKFNNSGTVFELILGNIPF